MCVQVIRVLKWRSGLWDSGHTCAVLTGVTMFPPESDLESWWERVSSWGAQLLTVPK